MTGRMAVDIGGTFTDIVYLDNAERLQTTKVPTTPENPARGVLEGAARILPEGLTGLGAFLHGTTIALNALLERRGARTGLITTRGFRDVLEIMRTNRPNMYDLQQEKPVPLVPRTMRAEADERLDSKGAVVVPLSRESVLAAGRSLVEQGAESIAICFLFSYLNSAHEEAAREILAEAYPGLPVSISSEVAREWREFERTSTAVINSYTRPLMGRYVDELQGSLAGRGFRHQVLFMQSNGGLLGGEEVKRVPVRTLLSGPVGGVTAGELVSRLTGRQQLLTLDIGGTSADMCLIDGGRGALAAEKQVEGWPVLFAAIDVTAIGAGGGSIAAVDRAGGLSVGPRSAGSTPGPACYGRGGTEPTVTDANLVLGYIDPDYFLGGDLKLDREAAVRAIKTRVADPLGMSVDRAAAGILQILNAKMLGALREVTLNRGYDVRDFTLLPYGGAGGLHAAALARDLGCAGVLVPVNPGVFSAMGMLAADLRYDAARTFLRAVESIDPAELSAAYSEMEAEGRRRLPAAGSGTVTSLRTADLRYRGQEYTLSVPVPPGPIDPSELTRRFAAVHRQFYGYEIPDEVWLVALRTVVVGGLSQLTLPRVARGVGDGAGLKGYRRIFLPEEGEWVTAPVYDREGMGAGDRIQGPAVVEERQSTILLWPGDTGSVDEYGNLIIEHGGGRRG